MTKAASNSEFFRIETVDSPGRETFKEIYVIKRLNGID